MAWVIIRYNRHATGPEGAERFKDGIKLVMGSWNVKGKLQRPGPEVAEREELVDEAAIALNIAYGCLLKTSELEVCVLHLSAFLFHL